MVLSQSMVLGYGESKRVVKRYNGIKSGKWALSPIMQLFYPFAALPKSRLERELNFLQSLDEIKKPRIYGFDMEKKEICREYIEEAPGSHDSACIGKTLSDIHLSGYSLGDSKLDNFVCNAGQAYIVDAEQAVKSRNKNHLYWDVSLLILSAAYRYYTNPEKFRSFLDGFSRSYVYWEEYRDRAVKGFYSLLFLFMPVQNMKSLKDYIIKG